jgi:hypothetical protein
MQGLFIPGGWAGKRDPRFGLTRAGLPSRVFCGPFFFRFSIGDRHTAYEWAMVLADRHPYPPHFGDMKAATVAGMQNRKSGLKIFSDRANAIYLELKAEFEAGRLAPLRREWCTDRPDALDFTRCTFGLYQVLPIIRRRGDGGRLIGKLLTAVDREITQAADPALPAGSSSRPHRQPRDRKDEGLIIEGCQMVKERKARSANEAAKILAEREGGHSVDATRDRLGRHIRNRLKSP